MIWESGLTLEWWIEFMNILCWWKQWFTTIPYGLPTINICFHEYQSSFQKWIGLDRISSSVILISSSHSKSSESVVLFSESATLTDSFTSWGSLFHNYKNFITNSCEQEEIKRTFSIIPTVANMHIATRYA